MIKAKHHIVIYPLFKWLSRILIRLNFKSVNIEGEFNDNGKAVLVIANHISWWDGFWIMILNQKVIRRRFHFMMLQEQLEKHWYFRYAGGYSIKKRSHSVFETIDYTLELMKHPENMVFIFPQGEIRSMHKNKMRFEKGVERIVRKSMAETQVIFVANLIDYFSDVKPNLFIYLKSFLAEDFYSFSIEEEYNKFYSQISGIQKNKIS